MEEGVQGNSSLFGKISQINQNMLQSQYSKILLRRSKFL